jgi:hypothetical protein
MKGAVILIGSLLWENEDNALNKKQGLLRSKWRKCLDLENKISIDLPIRYGRKSSSKKCTYTMVFSNSVETLGKAYLVPFKEDAKSFTTIREQAIQLSIAEGISTDKYPNRLKATWGAVSASFNRKKDLTEIIENWQKEFKGFNNDDYRIDDEKPSITLQGELNFEINLPDNIDYVFATPVKPELNEYPTIQRVAEAIIESKPSYDTYAKENYYNGIRVDGDEELMRMIK